MTNDQAIGLDPLFTRREVLEMSGKMALAGIAASSVSNGAETRPRIACVATYWAAPNSHADWIITKLLDGDWWKGAHTRSRLDGCLGLYPSASGKRTGTESLQIETHSDFQHSPRCPDARGQGTSVDGVVLVGEHGIYQTNLKGQTYYPRWWLYQQIIRVFEQSKRAVPVFKDKHLSTSWDEAKWMFDKSRELNFPLFGDSSIPFYYRKPEIELDIDTPVKASIAAGSAGEEGSLVSLCGRAPVLCGTPQDEDEATYLDCDGRSAATGCLRPGDVGPELSETLALPPHDRVRLHHIQSGSRPAPDFGQRTPEEKRAVQAWLASADRP